MSIIDNLYRASPRFAQTFLLNAKAAELHLERYGRKFEHMAAEFADVEQMSADECKQWQNERLTMLIRHAYDTVPYYSKLFKNLGLTPADITTLDDLPKLPILTKDDVRENYNDLISTQFKPSQLRRGNTSGTTGSPLNVAYDIPTCVAHHVVDWRQKAWGGMTRGDCYASLQGRVIVPEATKSPPFWRYNYINRQLFLSAFHLKAENLQFYVNELQRRGIQYLEGYPSTLYTLAAYLDAREESVSMQAVFSSSETLFPWQRDVISRAFRCQVFDSYGMAERVVYASECEQHSGRHLNEDYGITEIVDSEDAPLERGQTGRIVATSLHNFGFPLIRYLTNDVSALAKHDCACGRSYPLMEEVTTKQEAIITLPDGRWISPSVLTHPFKPMTQVAASQIIQEDLHLVRIRIVKRPGYTSDDEKLLIKGFRQRLGNDVELKVEYTDDVVKTASGKFKWVVSKVKPTFTSSREQNCEAKK